MITGKLSTTSPGMVFKTLFRIMIMTEVNIINTTELSALSIRGKVKKAEIPQYMGKVYGELMMEMRSNGWQGNGPPFAYYHSYEGDEIDVDRGIPVKSATTGTGRVRRFTLPAVRAARTVHVGPYVGIVKTYQSLERWIRDSDHEPVDHMWESYLNDPTEVMPEKLMTEIVWPIR